VREALRVTATRNHALGTVNIFTDAQAAIWRTIRGHAKSARKRIATLRAREPEVRIERNDIADGWAKLAADEPDAHWVDFKYPCGRVRQRRFPLPRSLTSGFSET